MNLNEPSLVFLRDCMRYYPPCAKMSMPDVHAMPIKALSVLYKSNGEIIRI